MTKIHYVYETINLINGKKYIGKHSTTNIDDGYLGSGKALKEAIKKYGKGNFAKTILKIFDTASQALDYEHSLVTKEIVEDDNYYNLILGGGNDGNAKHFLNGLSPKENAVKAANTLKSNPEKLEQRNNKISEALQKYYAGDKGKQKAAIMNNAVRGNSAHTKQSIKQQVETRKINHISRMNLLLVEISNCLELSNTELQNKFNVSYCTILRCKKRIENNLRWEDDIPDNLPHRLCGTAKAEWRIESSKKRAKLLRGRFTGEKSSLSKLSDLQREEIHSMVINGIDRKTIQSKFNSIVKNTTINREIVKAINKYKITNYPNKKE